MNANTTTAGECGFPGCQKTLAALGLCIGHYRQQSAGKELTALRSAKGGPGNGYKDSHLRDDQGRKRCVQCGEWQDVGEFTVHSENTDGLKHQCRTCEADRRRLNTYGVSPDRYQNLMAAQGGCCAICGDAFSDTNPDQVDHDHTCCPGRKSCGQCIRGLLCGMCNRMLGSSRDSRRNLASGMAYLRRNESSR